jgi:hypothetical protein
MHYMANTGTRAVVYNAILDEVIFAGLTSAPLTADASRIKYNGGNAVKIAKLSVTGYGNYDRGTGYPAGAATLAWEDHTITQDRGVAFTVDTMDEDETMQTLSATNLITEFSKNQAVPEIDSYRYSKIFQSIVDDATPRYGFYTPVVATVLGTLQDDIGEIRDAIGEQEPLVCFMSGATHRVLTQSTQLTKQFNVQGGGSGVDSRAFEIDGVPIYIVPSARMKTEYTFSATNGFAVKNFAQQMNYILMAKSAAVAFVKHSKLKVFGADVNQTADGELIQAREYHDLWVYENKHNAVYISLTSDLQTIDEIGGDVDSESGNIEITLGAAYTGRDTGHKFYYYDTNSASAPTAPAPYDEFDVTLFTEITVATEINVTTTATHYAQVVQLDENGRVVAYTAVAAGA